MSEDFTIDAINVRIEGVNKISKMYADLANIATNNDMKLDMLWTSSLFNLLENLLEFQKLDFIRIGQLQQQFSILWKETLGDKKIDLPYKQETKSLRSEVQGLTERFGKNFGSLEEIIDKINKKFLDEQKKGR